MLVALSAPVGWEPAVALLPDQAPDAVHKSAFIEFHVKVAEPPLATFVGLAVSVSVGAAGGASTVTVIDRVAVPPSPVHDNVKVLVDVRAPVYCEPDVVLSPDQAPDAVHESAFVELHVKVALPPLGTIVGLALSSTVGAGGGGVPATTTVTDCVAVPPLPEHVRENALLAARGPVLCEPDVGFAPDQAPDAEHCLAFLEVHVSVAESPPATNAGSAVN